jgi:predicted acetyltransferase/predicted lactoylglutathione lyase
LSISDEKQARQTHWELAQDAFDFLLDLKRGEPWPAYLARLENLRLGVGVPQGWVPATFLVAEVDGQVVGRVSIRHHLNPYLAEVGGHIGIGVRPDFRRRGYARAILRRSLSVAATTGLARVLVTCDANNVGAINATVDCGGVLENVAAAHRSVRTCRFWVETGVTPAPPRTPRSRTEVTHRPPPVRAEDDSALEQEVGFVTLGVADLNRAWAFYERLGWHGQPVGNTVFIRAGAIVLVLSGRDKLALDCGLHDEQAGGFSGVVLAHSVRSEAEVEEVIATAERAGAKVTRNPAPTSYGAYAGIFTDPDGHAWKVAHNPGSPLADDGSIPVAGFSTP